MNLRLEKFTLWAPEAHNRQVNRVTKLSTVLSNNFGFSAWNLLHVTGLAPRNFDVGTRILRKSVHPSVSYVDVASKHEKKSSAIICAIHYESFLGAFPVLRKLIISFVTSCQFVHLSVHMDNSTPTGRIFNKFDIWILLGNLYRELKFHWNLTRITGTLHEDLLHFLPYISQFL